MYKKKRKKKIEKVGVERYYHLWTQWQDVGQSDGHSLDLSGIEETHETQAFMD